MCDCSRTGPRLSDVLLGQDAAILISTHPQFTQINTINYTHCCFLIAVVYGDVYFYWWFYKVQKSICANCVLQLAMQKWKNEILGNYFGCWYWIPVKCAHVSDPGSAHQVICWPLSWWQVTHWTVELETNLREVWSLTIAERATARAFSCMKAPSVAFIFMNLLCHYHYANFEQMWK